MPAYGLGPYGLGPYGVGASNLVQRASYNGWVSWGAYNVGLLSFDHSSFDGTDVFGVSPLDATFGGTYDDVSKKLDTFTWKRGRSSNLDTMLAGSASVDLRDPTGLFNPDNASGPLYGQLEDRLHPIKLVGTYNGVQYGLFYGWVQDFAWQPSGRRGITRLNCVDLFYWLQRANPVIASTGPTTTGVAIGKILDSVGATDIAMRDLGVGDPISDFSATGVTDGLTLIKNLLDAERGSFFISGTGKATYRSRLDRLARTSAYTFTDTFTGAAPGVDWNQAYSRVTVTRTGGTPQTVSDPVAVAKVGYNDLPAITTPYVASDAQALSLAEWILSQNTGPKPPTRDFTIDNRDPNQLTQALTRELVDRISASESRGGSSGDYHIDSMSHTIDAHGGHTATYLLSKASAVLPAIFFDLATFDAGYEFTF